MGTDPVPEYSELHFNTQDGKKSKKFLSSNMIYWSFRYGLFYVAFLNFWKTPLIFCNVKFMGFEAIIPLL